MTKRHKLNEPITHQQAIDILKLIPTETPTHEAVYIDGRIKLRADPEDQDFDQKYTIEIEPAGEYVHVTYRYSGNSSFPEFAPLETIACGKRPGVVEVNIDMENRIAKLVALEQVIPRFLDAGYNRLPEKGAYVRVEAIAYGENEPVGKLLVVTPRVIQIETGSIEGKVFIDQNIHERIRDIIYAAR